MKEGSAESEAMTLEAEAAMSLRSDEKLLSSKLYEEYE